MLLLQTLVETGAVNLYSHQEAVRRRPIVVLTCIQPGIRDVSRLSMFSLTILISVLRSAWLSLLPISVWILCFSYWFIFSPPVSWIWVFSTLCVLQIFSPVFSLLLVTYDPQSWCSPILLLLMLLGFLFKNISLPKVMTTFFHVF